MSHPSGPQSAPDDIVGRGPELAAVGQLVPPAVETSDVLVLVGDAGIGKTTLLRWAAEQARAAGVRVLSARGSELEADFGYAGLHQMLRPALAHLDELADTQRLAVLTAFGLRAGGGAPDALTLGMAALSLLSRMADDGPVLLVVDDVQWLDEASLGTLSFLTRRLQGEPISLLAAARGEAPPAALVRDATVVEIGPLAVHEAERLLDRQPGAPTGPQRQRLLDAAAGNPLGIVELTKALARGDSQDTSWEPGGVLLTDRLENAFAGSWRALPDDTRRATLLAATADQRDLDELTPIVGSDLAIWAPAVEAGIVVLHEGTLDFRHPLARSGVYRAASPEERQAAHLAVAQALTGSPDRQVWHRAAAAVGPDELVAAALESIASSAEDRGGAVQSLSFYERAARLSPEPADRGRRLAKAAFVAMMSGQGNGERLAAEAMAASTDPGTQAWLTLLRSNLAYADLQPRFAAAMLLPLAEASLQTDLAVHALAMTAAIGDFANDQELTDRTADLFAQTASTSDELAPYRLFLRTMPDPITNHRAAADELAALLGSEASRSLNMGSILFGVAILVDGTEYMLNELQDSGAPSNLESWGSKSTMSVSIVHLGTAQLDAGRWTDARDTLSALTEAALTSGKLGMAELLALVGTAQLNALEGHYDQARAQAGRVQEVADLAGLGGIAADAERVHALAAAGEGEYDEAFERLRALFSADGDARHFHAYYAVVDLADAAVRTGRSAAVRPILDRARDRLLGVASPRLQLLTHHASALLTDDPDTAHTQYQSALGPDAARWPYEHARTQLDYGQWLRRTRRITEARTQLSAAKTTFDRIGAAPWSDRARTDLQAAGVAVESHHPSALDQLTAQQQQIVRLAADGLTNREIGERLFLSPRTIGFHLHQAFPKLGVTSRNQLRDLVAAPAS
ncbi:helix-turn-helix transcriptional regulator [Angustibacter sp. McL0619]|uniref:helix-turn-helix transcriptional regulator n=1 Tax=Angustibacter sp. McL0619 TaxID=3415676 RepID=UPI003CE919AC